MTTDYGTDVSTFPDGIDDDWSLVSGERRVAESVLRLWLTERGSMLTDENAGFFVLGLLSAGTTDADLAALARQLELEALGVEEVLACLCTVRQVNRETLEIRGRLTLLEGEEFEFIFSLTADKIAVLLPEAA